MHDWVKKQIRSRLKMFRDLCEFIIDGGRDLDLTDIRQESSLVIITIQTAKKFNFQLLAA